MISISNISGSQASGYYYERDPLFPNNSSWFGKTAERFGLEAGTEVGKAEFMALLAGLDPRTGEQLIPDGPNGHRAGVDLTISAPKGVSLLSLVSGDERLLEVFDEAVTKTLSYAEEHFAQVRQSIDGQKVRVDSGNFAIPRFAHSLSRAQDPQLHTHPLFLSISQREEDGKFVAIENRPLYQNRHLLDQVFKLELAAGVRGLGYAITTNEKGDFDITGVAPEVIEAFSKRRQQVIEKAAELKDSGKAEGLHDAEVRERATLESRDRKTHVDEATLRQRWDRELAELGTSKEQILEQALAAGREAGKGRELSAEDYVRTAAAALTESESIFTKAELLKTAGKLSVGDRRMHELEGAFQGMLETKTFVQLDGKDGGYRGVFTTKELHQIEKQVASMIRGSRGKLEPLMTESEASAAIDTYLDRRREQHGDFAITEGQREAVSKILTADSHILIQGAAGTGKSKSFEILERAISAYAGRDVELVGLSYTGKAASELEKSSGIPSMTLARFLIGAEGEDSSADQRPMHEIPRKERMYIVDEASMLGSRDAHKLLSLAEKTGSKVVLVGDVRQLLPISAGAIFSDAQQQNIIDVTMMTEVLRQKTQEMKELVAHVSEKRVDAAFENLERTGRLHEIKDRGELVQAVTMEYANRENWRDTLVLAATNEARQTLNHSIRQELQSQGKIGGEDTVLTVRTPKSIQATDRFFAQSYEEGDRIFASGGGGLRAGLEAKIVGVDHEQHMLTLDDGKGNLRLFDVKTHGDKISAYAEEDKPFAAGEKVIFLKNDRRLGVQNGLAGTIEKLDWGGNMTVRTESDEQLTFSTKNYSYFDYGAAISVHKSQGMTADNVIFHVDSEDRNINTTNLLYVAVTRGKLEAHVFTGDLSIRDQFKEAAVKSSTLQYDQKLAELDEREKMEMSNPASKSMERLSDQSQGKEEKTFDPEHVRGSGEHEATKDTERDIGDRGSGYELSL